MPINKEVLTKYKNNILIETGSWVGDGIQTALDVGFDRVISIELSPIYFEICQKRFAGCKYVELVLGDSSKILGYILSSINESVTFWLDGHYSGGDTGLGQFECPLMQELQTIAVHPIKTHKILIDDMRLWKMDRYGFGNEEITQAILKINPIYRFEYENGFVENDILAATIKDNK